MYLETLSRCSPERLVRDAIPHDAPHDVVAIGKAAGALLDGVAAVHRVDDAIVALPRGYRPPSTRATIVPGGHPDLTEESFEAGRRVIEFVDTHRDILFLISGGGSACVDLPLAPWFHERDLIETNARLVASALPIGAINTVRKHLSAIKGGRLGARVQGRGVTLVYSDVSRGAIADVASGPTLADTTSKSDAIRILSSIGGCDRIVAILQDPAVPETVAHLDNASAHLVADNDTLTAIAAEIANGSGLRTVRWQGQIEMDVADAARALIARAGTLVPGELLIAGGEPTVVVRGNGQGGRCSELALRFALCAGERGLRDLTALFATTDGVDGSSGAAGILLRTVPRDSDRQSMEAALSTSDSFPVAAQVGEPIIIAPSGNNLRDLYLVARG
ncbi:MAG: DUF4147 domain-containing protein [Thermoanaerobaculia bacterium]